jgi:hypothetical protein
MYLLCIKLTVGTLINKKVLKNILSVLLNVELAWYYIDIKGSVLHNIIICISHAKDDGSKNQIKAFGDAR